MLRTGMQVVVAQCSGLDSGCKGEVVKRSKVKTDGRGIPKLPGYYSPVDWNQESPVRLDDGRLIIMFDDRLQER